MPVFSAATTLSLAASSTGRLVETSTSEVPFPANAGNLDSNFRSGGTLKKGRAGHKTIGPQTDLTADKQRSSNKRDNQTRTLYYETPPLNRSRKAGRQKSRKRIRPLLYRIEEDNVSRGVKERLKRRLVSRTKTG